MERIHSHLLWLGIAGHILGFDTVLMQTWRMREPIMWACEAISGNRKTYGMNTIGGVRRDIPERLTQELMDKLQTLGDEAMAVKKAIVGDTTLLARTKRVGILTNEWAKKVCVVGPPARASNLAIDARIDHPYAAYDEIPVRIAVQDGCDTWARVGLEKLQIILHQHARGTSPLFDNVADTWFCAACAAKPATNAAASDVSPPIYKAPRKQGF